MNLREIRIALRELRHTGQTLPEQTYRRKIDAIIRDIEDAETAASEDEARRDAASWEDAI
jgi:hypothetical protein